MKHIFSVHSPITYFCAANVVLHEGLKKEDVIFLYTSFSPPNNLGIPVPSFYTVNQTFFKKLKTFNLVKSYDKYLDRIISGDQFQAYIDLAHYYQKLLITHSHCAGFHFIEEGTASYIAPKKLAELTRIESSTSFRFAGYKERIRAILRVLRGFNLRLLALPYFANSFTFLFNSKFYGFSPLIYPGVLAESKVILEAKSVSLSKEKEIKEIELSNSLILVEESYFGVYKIKEANVKNCIDQTMFILKSDLARRQVFVKLRPNQKASDSIWIAYLIKHQITYKVIPKQMVLEELLVNSEKSRVVGTVSSLLFYACIFGHEAFSNYDLLTEKPQSDYDELDFYWKKVKSIKLKSSE